MSKTTGSTFLDFFMILFATFLTANDLGKKEQNFRRRLKSLFVPVRTNIFLAGRSPKSRCSFSLEGVGVSKDSFKKISQSSTIFLCLTRFLETPSISCVTVFCVSHLMPLVVVFVLTAAATN